MPAFIDSVCSAGPTVDRGFQLLLGVGIIAVIRISQRGLCGWSIVLFIVEREIEQANCCKCSVHSRLGHSLVLIHPLHFRNLCCFTVGALLSTWCI